MIKAVLFDLDGTLAPMDQGKFIESYFTALIKKLSPYGYDPKTLGENIWLGTRAMVKNDGTKTNEKAFWDYFTSVYGIESKDHIPIFEEFYQNDFPSLVALLCTPNPDAKKLIELLKAKKIRVTLATNPLFPAMATETRIRWAGFEPSDFEDYTTYESCHYCKPNIKYYGELTVKLSLDPRDCLMVGNDVTEDTVPEALGMKVFLLTDFLINKENKDISAYPNGSFNDLIDYILSMEK